MTALLVNDNQSPSDSELFNHGIGDNDPPVDLTDANTDNRSAMLSASLTLPLSSSGTNSTPPIAPKVSWTPQIFPSAFRSISSTSKIGSRKWELDGSQEVDESLVKDLTMELHIDLDMVLMDTVLELIVVPEVISALVCAVEPIIE